MVNKWVIQVQQWSVFRVFRFSSNSHYLLGLPNKVMSYSYSGKTQKVKKKGATNNFFYHNKVLKKSKINK